MLQWVTGMSLSELELQPAVVKRFQRRQVKTECFPVLVPSERGRVSGLLVSGLTQLALQRAQFFEGEEYQLTGIIAEGMPDSHSRILKEGELSAQYFADNQVYDIEDFDWSIQSWRDHEKQEFMSRLSSYMNYFGSLSAAEADKHW